MRLLTSLRATVVCLALVPAVLACGASKSDFINDDAQVTAQSSGGSSTASTGSATSMGSSDGSGGTSPSGSGGSDSGATSTTSGAGGSGHGGDAGSTAGSDATASSGGFAATSTSAGTTNTTGRGGAGGNGGTGGADLSCSADADCGLATDLNVCCSCPAAYPEELIANDPCLLGRGENDSGKCEPILCPAVVCWACEEAMYASCDAGQCVARSTCPEGTILDRGSCVPPCTSNDDCVVATRADECCGGCPDAYHRQVLEEDACLVPQGESAPKACLPDPDECSLVLCPDILCVGPGSPVCDEQGLCGMTSEFTE